MKNIIFFQAMTQYENLGDLVINKTLLDSLRQYGMLVINVRGVPEWFCQELEIADYERASNHRMGFKITLLVSAFKSLFQPDSKIYFILTPGHHYNISMNFSRVIYLLKIISYSFLLKIIGVRICRFGASIGPFSKIYQIAEKCMAELMYFYSVRDTKSENYAKTIGISKVELFPDLAWSMKLHDAKSNFLENLLIKEYVIFSFREYPHALEHPGIYKDRLYLILDEIVKIVCRNSQKKIIISYQVSRDYEFCRQISNRYKNEYNVIFIEKQIDVQSIYEFYSQSSIIFSNRLHALIFGMVCGSTPIAIVDGLKHDKITGIFSEMKLMDLVVDISQENHRIEQLNKTIDNASQRKIDIALYIGQYKKSSEKIFKHVMKE